MNQPADPSTHHSLLQSRLSGVLLHPSSLPGKYGIGEIGPAAFEWIDLLQAARQGIWQVLPTGPTIAEDFHSPYSAVSAFAGNPLLISTDDLVSRGLLAPAELRAALRTTPPGANRARVDFRRVERFKQHILSLAAAHFSGAAADKKLTEFAQQQPWVAGFVAYAALREQNRCGREHWPREARCAHPDSIPSVEQILASSTLRKHLILQYLFFEQWGQLKQYANTHGIKLFGDLPIYVSGDSADVWAKPEYFRLNAETKAAELISGVPPDVFSATGQVWGHPVYNWEQLQQDNFSWWVERFRTLRACFDLVRVDHFRGFESFWAIPAGSKGAQGGSWLPCPGDALFERVQQELGELPFFVEDLGIITPEVHALRERFHLFGTRVVQFAFGGDPAHTTRSRHHPVNVPHTSVVYTGTHDNQPLAEWFGALPAANKRKVLGLLDCTKQDQVARSFVRLALSLPAQIVIVPLQDLLGLGKGSRMNLPGTASWTNWSWRIEKIPSKIGGWLAGLSEVFERNEGVQAPSRAPAGRAPSSQSARRGQKPAPRKQSVRKK
jgi:4-alpha-glucanotransferase